MAAPFPRGTGIPAHLGARRAPLTDKPTGVLGGQPLPDGSGVVWFDDHAGAEVGRYVVTPSRGDRR